MRPRRDIEKPDILPGVEPPCQKLTISIVAETGTQGGLPLADSGPNGMSFGQRVGWGERASPNIHRFSLGFVPHSNLQP